MMTIAVTGSTHTRAMVTNDPVLKAISLLQVNVKILVWHSHSRIQMAVTKYAYSI